MKRKKILLLFLCTLFASCTKNKDQSKLLITGSSTIAPLIADIAKAYEKSNAVKIDIQTGGSSRGIYDIRKKLSHIGMVSRALKKSETDLEAHLIAYDGIAITLHKDNPVNELTKEQIVSIYTGKIKNWSELNGNKARISVIHKAAGRSTQEVFLKFFKLKDKQIKATSIIGDNEQAIKLLASDPNAIAYISIGTIEYYISQNKNLKMLPLNTIVPSSENVRKGIYPLARELNLISHKSTQLHPEALKFIKHITSKKMSSKIMEYYFVPSN